MPEHRMHCACGHAFTITESDYEKVGRCAGCNRNIRVYLLRGEAFIEPVSASGQVLPIFGDEPAYSKHTQSYSSASESHTLIVKAANDVSLFESDGGDADEIHAPKIPAPTCARCGKAFRGDWDKRPTDKGVLCYICSTLSIDPPQKQHAQNNNRDNKLVSLKLPPPPVYDVLAEYNDELGYFQRHGGKFVFAALGIAAMLCVVIFPLDKIIPQLLTPVDISSFQNNSAQVQNAFLLIGFFVQFVRIFLWLYLGLLVCDKLPNDLFRHNAIVVGIYSAGFFLLQMIAGGINYRLSMLGYIISIYILDRAFDLDLWDILKFIVIGVTLGFFAQPITLMLLNVWLLSAH